jgi:uncharacterized DUF497 family protein
MVVARRPGALRNNIYLYKEIVCIDKRHTNKYFYYMVFDWNEEKNQQLKKERNISFERVVLAIEENHILDVMEHPNRERYKNQYLIIVEIDEYAYVIPAICSDENWFLKTIYPNRKFTEKYLPGKRRK